MVAQHGRAQWIFTRIHDWTVRTAFIVSSTTDSQARYLTIIFNDIMLSFTSILYTFTLYLYNPSFFLALIICNKQHLIFFAIFHQQAKELKGGPRKVFPFFGDNGWHLGASSNEVCAATRDIPKVCRELSRLLGQELCSTKACINEMLWGKVSECSTLKCQRDCWL